MDWINNPIAMNPVTVNSVKVNPVTVNPVTTSSLYDKHVIQGIHAHTFRYSKN